MNIYKRTALQGTLMRRKSTRITLLPLFLIAALALMLAACGNAGSTSAAPGSTSTSAATSEVQGSTSTSTASSQSSNSTPSMPVSSNTLAAKPASQMTGIRMLDKNNGWALTDNSILKTMDGGVHWNDVTPANAEINQFAKGDFLNGQYAWIAIPPAQQIEGPGIVVLHTTDGGNSWQSTKINDPAIVTVDVPHFLNAQQGWLEASSSPGAGHAGSDIWHSTDGGQTWSKSPGNVGSSGLTLGYVTGISFKDAQTGIATGNLGAGGDNSQPSVAITQDGGHTWLTDILPHLLGGYNEIMSTSEPPVFFGNVVFLPVIVSAQDNPNLLVLYRSNDSGLHWVQTSVAHIESGNTYVLDPYHAWATDGQSGKLYSTTDGGNNWLPTSNTAYKLNALSFTDANTGWGISGKTLLHTTDGGKTWQQINYSIQ